MDRFFFKYASHVPLASQTNNPAPKAQIYVIGESRLVTHCLNC